MELTEMSKLDRKQLRKLLLKEFKMIGMGEYTHSFDSKDEPLIQLNMVERENQNWDERVVNDIQIHYKNLYITEKQSIRIRKCETEISIYDIARRINSNDIDLFLSISYLVVLVI